MTTRPLYVASIWLRPFDRRSVRRRRGHTHPQQPGQRPDAEAWSYRPRAAMSSSVRASRRFLDSDPANTRSEFKRLMGTTHALEFPASGTTRRPEELSAEVLKSLRQDVADQLGSAGARRRLGSDTVRAASDRCGYPDGRASPGFERVELHSGAVASAIAAGWSQSGSTDRGCLRSGWWHLRRIAARTREGLLRVCRARRRQLSWVGALRRALMDVARPSCDRRHCDRIVANSRHAQALRRCRWRPRKPRSR